MYNVYYSVFCFRMFLFGTISSFENFSSNATLQLQLMFAPSVLSPSLSHALLARGKLYIDFLFLTQCVCPFRLLSGNQTRLKRVNKLLHISFQNICVLIPVNTIIPFIINNIFPTDAISRFFYIQFDIL